MSDIKPDSPAGTQMRAAATAAAGTLTVNGTIAPGNSTGTLGAGASATAARRIVERAIVAR